LTRRPIRLLELRSAWGAGGGPEKTILLSAARHDPALVDVRVAYLRSPWDARFDEGIGARAREHGVPLIEVPDRRRFDITCIARLRRMARWADVIHAHDYKTDVYALLLGRGGGQAKLVATAHGWTGESRKVRFYQKVDLVALRRFDRVIAVSSATRDVLVEGGVDEARIDLLHNAVDVELWRPGNGAGDLRAELGLSRRDVVVGTVARLSLEKGVDLLLAAIQRANEELAARGMPRPVVLVAGDGPERADLEWSSRLRGIGAQVRFLGHRSDPLRVANTLDISVLPSRVENLPNALLEHMALGKACIAFEVGGVPELLGQAGVGVRPLDTDALGHAIVELIMDETWRRELGVWARARIVERFSFEQRLRRIESIYESVVAGRAPERTAGKWSWAWTRPLAQP
jgi:glycosyltransferase involved in cell wall biosynthesis